MLEKEWFELMDTSSSSKHSWRAAVGFADALCSLRCRFPDQDNYAGLGVRNNTDRGFGLASLNAGARRDTVLSISSVSNKQN